MKNVLISGHTGFVGANLAVYLGAAGHVVDGLSRQREGQKNAFTWDNLERLKEQCPDSIVHLAGKAHDVKNTSGGDEYFKVNTDLTKKLFDIFLESKATTFIYFSSVKAVADSVTGILTEDISPSPKTPYGQSKQQAEAYILSASLPPGKRVYILRPCMIHGPGNKGNLNLLYKFVQKGIPYPLAAFDNRRSFLSIGNLNYIVGRLIDDLSIPGGIYNLADDEPLSTNTVINIISEINGLKAKLWSVSPKLIKTVAVVGDNLRFPLNSERLKKLTESYVVSNTKIKKALDICHLPVSSTDGLKVTIQSFKSA